jgi:plastocyanin
VTPRHLILTLGAVAAAVTPLSGCGGGESHAGSSPKPASAPASGGTAAAVKIAGFKFAPARLTAKSGAKITVSNDDSTAHTFTANDGTSFDTGPLDPGSSQTVSVSKPGSYAYHCSIHPFMKGTLSVR